MAMAMTEASSKKVITFGSWKNIFCDFVKISLWQQTRNMLPL